MHLNIYFSVHESHLGLPTTNKTFTIIPFAITSFDIIILIRVEFIIMIPILSRGLRGSSNGRFNKNVGAITAAKIGSNENVAGIFFSSWSSSATNNNDKISPLSTRGGVHGTKANLKV